MVYSHGASVRGEFETFLTLNKTKGEKKDEEKPNH